MEPEASGGGAPRSSGGVEEEEGRRVPRLNRILQGVSETGLASSSILLLCLSIRIASVRPCVQWTSRGVGRRKSRIPSKTSAVSKVRPGISSRGFSGR